LESIQFKDNQGCLDLIEAKTGVLALLDEECRIPKGTDETYLSKLHENLGKNECYVKPRTAKSCFGIKHYAGEVVQSPLLHID
jgi:myosin-5